jgi:hypothetical protein
LAKVPRGDGEAMSALLFPHGDHLTVIAKRAVPDHRRFRSDIARVRFMRANR